MGHTHIAVIGFPYAGARLEAGQGFTPANEWDSHVLTAMGLARPLPHDGPDEVEAPTDAPRRRGRPRKPAVE